MHCRTLFSLFIHPFTSGVIILCYTVQPLLEQILWWWVCLVLLHNYILLWFWWCGLFSLHTSSSLNSLSLSLTTLLHVRHVYVVTSQLSVYVCPSFVTLVLTGFTLLSIIFPHIFCFLSHSSYVRGTRGYPRNFRLIVLPFTSHFLPFRYLKPRLPPKTLLQHS